MEASASVSVSSLAGRIEPRWAAVRRRRVLEVSTAAAVIAYVVAVALPRYMLAGDLRREIGGLVLGTEQASAETTPVTRGLSTARPNELEGFIEPADLLPAATVAGRRAGLHLTAVKQVLPQAASDRTRRISLHATASFEQIVGFLDEISALSPTLRVDALSVLRPVASGAAPGPVKLELECTLSVEPLTRIQAAAAAPEKVQ